LFKTVLIEVDFTGAECTFGWWAKVNWQTVNFSIPFYRMSVRRDVKRGPECWGQSQNFDIYAEAEAEAEARR